MRNLVVVFGVPLVLTILIELVGALALKVRKLADLRLVALVNCVTNPLVVAGNLLLSGYLGEQRGLLLTMILLEPFAVIAEWLYYRKYIEAEISPALLSFILNLLSFTGGIICSNTIW